METAGGQSNKSVQSWIRKVENTRKRRIDYIPEMRTWIQRAIIDAEKRKNPEAKEKLLELLKDLKDR